MANIRKNIRHGLPENYLLLHNYLSDIQVVKTILNDYKLI